MRYIIGIDLGTTNCCVSYVDREDPKTAIRTFAIPQLVGPGQIEMKPLLPSFCYLAGQEEWDKGSIALPWAAQRDYMVGSFALSYGARVPTRLVASAKSWLCHNSAARKDPILPPGGDAALRISPVEASSRYLRHIAAAWNAVMAKEKTDDEFEQQQIIITVPASFDEVARALTIESAKKAGFVSVSMLEEPQAAFYNWIDQHEKKWSDILDPGARILVCDVGGGTTDFSYIKVQETEDKLSFMRMAVGDHLLLGGENIDNALAQYISDKLAVELSPAQWQHLCHQARLAKEAIYGNDESSYRIVLTGTGSKVVGGTQTYNLTKAEADAIVLDGFFGNSSWSEAIKKTSTTGFKTLGLPYEQEPSIVKHLARFLDRHQCTGDNSPTHILFNGGTMLPGVFQDAILKSLEQWFPHQKVALLTAQHFDHAVARGAAYFGKVKHGLGIRIGGGSPRAYYLGIELNDGTQKQFQALTLLPRGTEEDTSYISEKIFQATPNLPVAFQVYTSHVRLNDKAGDIIPFNEEELHPLPPIHTILRYGKGGENTQPIAVQLGIHLTSIGILEVWLQSTKSDHRWGLEFQLRTVGGQDNSLGSVGKARKDETYNSQFLAEATAVLQEVYSGKGSVSAAKSLMEKLEKTLDMPRKEWPLSVLRGLWSPLLDVAAQRSHSQQLNERWWNLAGFLLRPGKGYPLDDFRIKDLWKIILGEIKKNNPSEVLQQQLICFRRIAAGLNRGQQLQLAGWILPNILTPKGLISGKPPYLYQERLRTLASMELIEISTKVKIGQALVDKIIQGEADRVEYWALSKIAARQQLQGTLSHIIPPAQCSIWIEKLLKFSTKIPKEKFKALFIPIARLTGHREIDLPLQLRQKLADLFEEESRRILLEVVPMTEEEQDESFGEALPHGLQLQIQGG
ncbi:MAG: Hsp70 family protein [Parachlamydiales bacterium]|jgi:hypothetical protein